MASDGVYSVTLDEAIEAMRLTAADMSVKYKETSLSVGGLRIMHGPPSNSFLSQGLAVRASPRIQCGALPILHRLLSKYPSPLLLVNDPPTLD
jgi:hypothetical protein